MERTALARRIAKGRSEVSALDRRASASALLDAAPWAAQPGPARSHLVPTGVWAAPVSFLAGEFADTLPLISPASTNANRAEKAAFRVAFDAPLSMIARCTASMIALVAYGGSVMMVRLSLIAF